jgi:hypothetical protein
MINNRILYITRTDPSLKGGGSKAEKSFIMAFHQLYPGKVDLIMADAIDTNHFDLPVKFYLVPSRNKISRFLSLLTGSLHRFRRYVMRFLSMNHEKYSLCVFGGSIIAGDLVDYVNSLGIRTVTIHHNYEKEYHLHNKTVECFKGLFPYYVIRNERNAYLKSALNLFLTEQDKNTFFHVYGPTKGLSKVRGVSEPDYEEEKIEKSTNRSNHALTIVISGTMSSYQTKLGIIDFYKNYYSIVKDIAPQARITFTGRNPGMRLLKMVSNEQETMQMIPNPLNIDEVVRQGDIYLCPTHIGGGLKLRLMDGLKAGLPVLTHSVSARGYDVFFDKPWFQVYNDKASFQNGLTILMDGINKSRWSSMEIQKAYRDYFSFEAGVKRLEACLMELELSFP